MKQARMNGEIFNFPDTMDDAEIDAIMARHGQTAGAPAPAAPAGPMEDPAAGGAPAVAQPDPMVPMMIQGIATFFQQQKASQDQQMQTEGALTKAQMDQSAAECAEKLKVLSGIGQALVALAEQSNNFQNIGAAAGEIQHLTQSVNNLSQTIVESVTSLMRVIMMPREIYHNSQGVPVGTQVKPN